tara:strand:+ start:1692 stop:2042 length:351 start_codon:yes stop_codon:yes gene_type:complete
MAIPSGSGTEVLKRGTFTVTDTTDTKIIDGTANHLYTVLSITVCETAGNAETFDLFLDPSAGGTDYEILSDQALGANKTFVFNDRIVMSGTDELNFKAGGTCDIDIIISYIDQDWT